MDDRENSCAGHNCYPAINISGNARAIIGNVYERNEAFLSNTGEGQIQLINSQGLFAGYGRGHETLAGGFAVQLLKVFEDVATTFSLFRNIDAKLERHSREIRVRSGIFKHTIRTFLEPIVDPDTLTQMLCNDHHPGWSDKDFRTSIAQTYRNNLEPLTEILELIKSDLTTIAEYQTHCLLTGREACMVDSKVNLKQKIVKFVAQICSYRQAHDLGGHLESLEKHTKEFRTLIRLSLPQEASRQATNPSSQTALKIGRYQRIQEAAGNLYNAFGLACTKHSTHRAQLRLEADSMNPSQVSFALLMEHKELLPTGLGLPPLSLTVESQVTGTITHDNVDLSASQLLSCLVTSNKRNRDIGVREDTSTDEKLSEPKRRVGFAPLAPMSSSLSHGDALVQGSGSSARISRSLHTAEALVFDTFASSGTVDTETSIDDFPNFCRKSDFCTRVKSVLSCKQQPASRHPLGYLHSQSCAKHLIYLNKHVQSFSLESTCQPHLTALRGFSQDRKFSKVERISLAKHLSIAVLQYHATPWLETWDADHVLVNRAVPTNVKPSANEDLIPYVDVAILNPNAAVACQTITQPRTLIPNWTLFRLGVMLLELAYQRPLRDMRQTQDHYPNEHDTDFFTARRLRLEVAGQINSIYADVVHRCIQCDFGKGDDFSTRALQESYYENVVRPLQDLEAQFKKLEV